MNFFKSFDWGITIAVLVLAGISLAVIQSVQPSLFLNQLIFYLISFLAYFIFSQIDFEIYRPFKFVIYLVSCLLLLGIYILGVESRGAIRWLEIAGFRLQISEILKPFFLVFLAAFLADRPPRKFGEIFKTGLLCLAPLFLVWKQPDLGSALVYGLTFVGMLWAARLPLKYFFLAAVSGLLFAPLGWRFLHDYQKNRLLSFLNPVADPQGTSYNAIQAIIAVGSGMIWGKGLGHGTQSQLLFLPEKHTDFIFASRVEELGLAGGTVLLVFYGLIFYRLLALLARDEDLYGNLYLVGVLFLLLGQMFINIGMNLGLLPITGITLPLVSYGGSSLLALMIALGIAQNLAKKRGSSVQSESYL
jgi:rod shape determining protein RodA